MYHRTGGQCLSSGVTDDGGIEFGERAGGAKNEMPFCQNGQGLLEIKGRSALQPQTEGPNIARQTSLSVPKWKCEPLAPMTLPDNGRVPLLPVYIGSYEVSVVRVKVAFVSTRCASISDPRRSYSNCRRPRFNCKFSSMERSSASSNRCVSLINLSLAPTNSCLKNSTPYLLLGEVIRFILTVHYQEYRVTMGTVRI